MTKLVAFLLLFFVIFATPVSAYVDPTTGSLFAQLVVGSILGIVIFSKNLRQKIKKLKHIFFARDDKE